MIDCSHKPYLPVKYPLLGGKRKGMAKKEKADRKLKKSKKKKIKQKPSNVQPSLDKWLRPMARLNCQSKTEHRNDVQMVTPLKEDMQYGGRAILQPIRLKDKTRAPRRTWRNVLNK